MERTVSKGDVRTLAVGVVAYVLVVYLAVPAYQTIFVGAGMLAFWAAYVVSRKLGPVDPPRTEPGVIMMAAAVIFGIPVLGARAFGGGVAAAGIGMFTAQGIWAINRYVAEPGVHRRRRSIRRDLRWGFGWGFGLGCACSIWAAILIVTGRDTAGRAADTSGGLSALPLIVALYLGLGAMGGGIMGLLRPIDRRPLGVMATGVLIAVPVFIVISLMLARIDPTMRFGTTRTLVLLGVGMGVLMGPPFALALRSPVADAPAAGHAMKAGLPHGARANGPGRVD